MAHITVATARRALLSILSEAQPETAVEMDAASKDAMRHATKIKIAIEVVEGTKKDAKLSGQASARVDDSSGGEQSKAYRPRD